MPLFESCWEFWMGIVTTAAFRTRFLQLTSGCVYVWATFFKCRPSWTVVLNVRISSLLWLWRLEMLKGTFCRLHPLFPSFPQRRSIQPNYTRIVQNYATYVTWWRRQHIITPTVSRYISLLVWNLQLDHLQSAMLRQLTQRREIYVQVRPQKRYLLSVQTPPRLSIHGYSTHGSERWHIHSG